MVCRVHTLSANKEILKCQLRKHGCMSPIEDESAALAASPQHTTDPRNSDPLSQLLADPGKLAECYRPWLRELASSALSETMRVRLDESDIVQETLMEACRDLDSFRGNSRGDLEAWLRQVLQNQILDAVKHHQRQRRSVEREVSVEFSEIRGNSDTASRLFTQKEAREQLWKVIETLPQHYRDIILMRQQMDLTFAEIGERTDRTPDAARMLWGRAILVLTARLQGETSEKPI